MIGEQPTGRIRVGTSGWSYEDWRGIVYPEHPRPRDELRFLAGFVDALEVNSSFYRPPTAATTESWLRRTADLPDFRFTFKLHQRFTHQRAAVWTKVEAEEYRQGLQPVAEAGRLGAVLMQFPWSFRYLPENADWLKRLADMLRPWPLVAEVRHDSWLADEAAALLAELELTMASIDQPQLENCIPPCGKAQGPLAYVRLHGRNSRHWWGEQMSSHERYNYLYSDSELDEWVDRIRGLARQSQIGRASCRGRV